MSDLPEPEILETKQVAVWRMPDEYKGQWWNPQWRVDREQDLQDAREMLSHLTENQDWFFVQVCGSDIDVFFTDARQAVMFKLRHII